MSRIAIIGAGLAGLALARELRDFAAVTVFEKSRGFGGRMATRYTERFQFDFGAQYFTVKEERFRRFLQPSIDDGTLQRWDAHFVEIRTGVVVDSRQWGTEPEHFVPVPKMTSLARRLAAGLDVRRGVRVDSLKRRGTAWQLLDDNGAPLGEFDWVLSTAPAEQSAALLDGHSPLAESIDELRMQACFSLMLGLDGDPGLPWQAALVHDSPVSWISLDSSKPGRSGHASLVVHSANAWADEHIDDDPQDVQAALLAAACEASGLDLRRSAHMYMHCWRFANMPRHSGPEYLLDADARLAACGDWLIHGRVEAAFLSAAALAGRLLEFSE